LKNSALGWLLTRILEHVRLLTAWKQVAYWLLPKIEGYIDCL